MYFNNTRVTIENITEVFANYSLDIQDEVRSMLLDGVDLSQWIEVCRKNPYRLYQIRLAVREGIDSKFFKLTDGLILYRVRLLAKQGFNIEKLTPYISSGFNYTQWNYILDWFQYGYLDDRLRLARTPDSLWPYIDKGLKKGLPMWLFTTGRAYSPEAMRASLLLLSRGYAPDKYISHLWSTPVLEKIAEFSPRRWFRRLEPLLKPTITLDALVALGKMAREGMAIEKYGHSDEDGTYTYLSYHLEALYQAIKEGFPTTSLENPNLTSSEVDMALSYLRVNAKKEDRFRGRL